MPHIILEHSENVGRAIDIGALLGRLHAELGGTEEFELDRLKSRAIETKTHVVGKRKDVGFVHATIMFSKGRSEAKRTDLGKRLMAILTEVASTSDLHIVRSVEIREFADGMYWTDQTDRRSPS